MRSRPLFSLLLGLSMALLSACASVPDTVMQDPHVEALGKMSNLAIPVIRGAEKNGFLGVQAEVVNYATSPQTMHYRFRWMDSSGMVVGSEEAWKVAVLQALDKKFITAVAPVKQAVDFRMVVQSPDNSVFQPGGPSAGGPTMGQ
ncbi:MAG: YcfL family protein [Magnetococcales bacterium]|nr:YcfL family protein [Magnetococcales bacterium]NGZ28059.1 YcfL family protein [Magnetococcales bacterium]